MSDVKKPWCYDLLFEDIREAWDAHDKTCESLGHMWLGRHGGVSSPADMGPCDHCDVWFFWEGLVNVNWDKPREDRLYLCECCRRKLPTDA